MMIRGNEEITMTTHVFIEDEYGQRVPSASTDVKIEQCLVAEAAGSVEFPLGSQQETEVRYTVYAPRGEWVSKITPEASFLVRGQRFYLQEPVKNWQPPVGFRLVTPRVILSLTHKRGVSNG